MSDRSIVLEEMLKSFCGPDVTCCKNENHISED